MRVALAQINTTVGDMEGNVAKMIAMARQAADRKADVVVFPELAIVGYPPRDLLEKPSFYEKAEMAERRLASETATLNITLIYGTVGHNSPRSFGKPALNLAVVLERGNILFRQAKMLLPTYDVFDEARYFKPAERQVPCWICGVKTALTVCEDAWNDKQYWERPLYERDPVDELVSAGARLLISINASPFHMGKRRLRHDIFSATARHHKIPVVYVNQVGGNDELVFDGSSFVMDATGQLIAVARSFEEDLVIADLEARNGDWHESALSEEEAVYEALVLGTRDYVQKCGFQKVLLGLSGGIDSSLTAVIATEAVGRDSVVGVAMPGPYSSEASLTDARALAQNLGIRFEVIPIVQPYHEVLHTLQPVFAGLPPDVTEENIQARLRGLILMALSNKWNALVLTTGNKSELAVGYCTLYGDMAGGLAVISDVPKTMVYRLARIANRRNNNPIPENVFQKAPSAELRPNQKDTDSLPEYEVLDAVLHLYIEENRPSRQIAEQLNLPLDFVRHIVNMVDRNEYKRRQAPPGLKVTTKAFGMGRRFPIAQRFRE